MIKQWLLAGALAASVIAAGCGGGGSGGSGNSGSSSGSTSGSGPTGTAVTVSGPLSTVQSTLSSSVLTPLQQATAGTPLHGVVVCTGVVVNNNTLDILNSILDGLQNPTTLSTTTPTQIQSLLQEMTNNLGSMLTALGGSGGGCGSNSSGGSLPGTNPLAGTPLAPLGAALLPVLQQIQSALASGAGSSGGSSGIAQLAALFDQLNAAFQSGLSQLPSSVTSQPVLGGALTTLGSTISNLAAMMDAFAVNNTSAFQTATQNLLTDLLEGLLTQVVPLSYIETQAGKPGVVTNPIDSAVMTFSTTVAGALAQSVSQLQSALSSSSFAPVMTLVNQVLSTVIGPITTALASAGSGSSSGGGATGTPLDPVLATLTSALKGILGTTSSSCVFASIPVLSPLCLL